MAARKWLIRSVFPLLILTAVGGGLWIYSYMKPAYVRQQIIRYLETEFPELQVEVGSAYLRLFGGISVSDLRLTRKDDPSGTPFLIVPHAMLVHDKEAFQRGEILLRKVELTEPRLRLERFASGKWNIEDLFRSGKQNKVPPTMIVKNASLTFIDQRIGKEVLLEVNETDLTILNDPKTIFTTEVQVKKSSLGGFTLQGRLDTEAGDWFASLDFKSIPFEKELTRIAMLVSPEAAKQLQTVQGTGSVQLKVHHQADQPNPLTYDLRVELFQCRVNHPDLPIELEDLNLKARCDNGHLIIEKATARSGQAMMTLSLDLPWKQANIECPSLKGPRSTVLHRDPWSGRVEGTSPSRINPLLGQTMFEHLHLLRHESPCNLPLPPKGRLQPVESSELIQELESRLRKLDVSITNLPLNRELFRRLPPKIQSIQKLFQPEGAISLSLEFRREGDRWRKNLTVRPEGFTARYEDYPYPVSNIRGKLDQVFSPDQPDQLTVDLTGLAAGKMITIKGHVIGDEPDIDIDLKIKADGLPLDDEELIKNLPKPYPQIVRRMHAVGRGDLSISIKQNAEVRRLYGPEEFDNEFYLNVFEGKFNYEEFPYPLEKMQGTLYIRTQPLHPTRLPPSPGITNPPAVAAPDVSFIELRNFVASHQGAKLKFSGKKEPTTGGTFLTMQVEANGLDFDRDLLQAMMRFQLDSVLRTFSPRGKMNCILQAKLFQRMDSIRPHDSVSDPDEELELNLAFAGAAIQPIFFPYLLTNVAGQLSYAKNRVEVFDLSARHRDSLMNLGRTEVILRQGGGFWADIRDLHITPLSFDADLFAALPPGLRGACQSLEFKGPISLSATRMVIDEQAGPPRPRMLPTPDPTPTLARGYRPEGNTLQPDPVPYSSSGESTRSKEGLTYLPTVYWDGKLTFTNASMTTGVPWENLTGSIASRGLFEADKLGRVIANLSFDQGRIAKQPVQDLVVRFVVDPQQPDIVKIPLIRGSLYGGEIGGEARLVLQNPLRYDLKLNATRIRLEEVAKQQKLGPKVQLEGLATAQLFLQNPVDEKTKQPIFQGGGSIDVPSGKLLNLPHMLDLLKVFKGKPPDETAFEEAKILFRIRGNRVMIGQLDLMGNAISLGGQGEMNIDGSNMNLEFYTVWTRVNNLLAPPLNDVTAAFSKALFKVLVKGDLGGKTEIKKEPVPFLYEPAKRVLDRVKPVGTGGK